MQGNKIKIQGGVFVTMLQDETHWIGHNALQGGGAMTQEKHYSKLHACSPKVFSKCSKSGRCIIIDLLVRIR